MRAVTLKKNYKSGEEYNYFLCSDLHLESPEHDRKLLIKELDYAVKQNADIFIGGDVFDFILNGDKKRYTPTRNKYTDTDSVLNEALAEAIEVLTPYAKNIKVILCGNHESMVIKHHSIDILALLIYELNKLEGVYIQYLGYQGYIRIAYKYASGNQTHTFDIKASHGSGGGAIVTKGTIGINRQMSAAIADMYWSGHTHTKVILPDENCSYMDSFGNIKYKSRKGVITGAYVMPVQEEYTEFHGRPNPYGINYGDMMKSLQSTGGVMMTHTFHSVVDMDIRMSC